VSTLKLAIGYFVRFLGIMFTKMVVITVDELRFIVAEELKGREEPPMTDTVINKLNVNFSYAADERLLVNFACTPILMSFNPENPDSKLRMEFYATNLGGRFKLPGTHDPLASIFSSSVKISVDQLTGNFKDKAFLSLIQFPQKQLLIKQLRRAFAFQRNPAEHMLKFKTDLLGNDTIKVVS
jgi:hypothetical protein